MEQDLGVVNAGEDENEDASDEPDCEHGFEKINENSDDEFHSRYPDALRPPLFIGNERG